MKAVPAVNFNTVDDFVKHHLLIGQYMRTDAFRMLEYY